MNARNTAAALTLAIVMSGGIAVAQPQGGPGMGMRCQQRFSSLDTNRDGRVTVEEFMAVSHPRGEEFARQTFAARDLNRDGVLTAAEFCPGR